jgi:hypothetical protein
VSVAAPKATRLVAEEILEIVERRPGITIPELVDELVALREPEAIQATRDVLERVLEQAQVKPEAPDLPSDWGPEPSLEELANARAAGEGAREAALAEVLANSLTRDEAAVRLGISPQAVSERLKTRRLVAFRRGREWRFPVWQFGDDTTLPGLDRLIASWPGTPLDLSIWAQRRSADLGGRTPADELKRRDGVDRVIELVDAIASAAW